MAVPEAGIIDIISPCIMPPCIMFPCIMPIISPDRIWPVLSRAAWQWPDCCALSPPAIVIVASVAISTVFMIGYLLVSFA